jgi:hypothetical protein
MAVDGSLLGEGGSLTDAKAIPLEDVVGCRDGCAAWLARSLGLDAFRDPATAAIGLLLGGGLNRKQAEVAHVLVWIDRALPLEHLLAEHESGKGLLMYIRPGKDANCYEVETAAPSDEDIQIHREVAAFEGRVNEALRKVDQQWNGLEDLFVRFCEAVMRLEESVAQRVQQGRVGRVVPGPRSAPETEKERRAAEGAVRNWTNRHSRVNAMLLKYAAVHAELSVLHELTQLRRPFDVTATDPFASLVLPSTLDEWRTARRVLEKALFVVGCDDAEIGTILPDGTGDGRRRVAARRKRMSAQKTAG